ncbi:MAG TPA: NAD(P)/FAD-dependent oxidoreductase [Acidimicrobiales bacterium]|nr:NAD(P)/FAD-dependent oxidoreductase [Acidimicrobiales bacterium]
MVERFDVVVVGARCAGSPLAALLAAQGVSVALVDKATFPSDTLSTHIFQNDGARVLARIGVLDAVLASGAPWLEQAHLRVEDLHLVHRWPRRPDDPGPMLSVRRPLLDALLVGAAEKAGASVRTGTRVTGLLERQGRVAGVRVEDGRGSSEIEATLVVGADGRASAVARFTGARRYNVVEGQRLACWGYYEGAAAADPATFYAQRWAEEYLIACPCDTGLFLVVAVPPLDRATQFREDLEAAFDAHVVRCEPVAATVAEARRVGRPSLVAGWTGYFRESAGPGWVLVGDAGHFKDPSPGQGITDALRQAERLAAAVVEGLDSGGRFLDRTMRGWWRWRDRDAWEMAWFAHDLGRGGRVPPVLVEILRRLESDEAMVDRWFDVLNHRTRPSEILTPARLVAATTELLRRGETSRARVLADTRQIVAQDVGRRWLNHRPRFD